MARVIRVDNEVYAWLQSQARPFEDSPNSVLRRLARLATVDSGLGSDEEAHEMRTSAVSAVGGRTSSTQPLPGRVTGERLRQQWNVPARHALYHREGTFYENLEHFPGALFDPHGYVVFRTEKEYRSCPYLSIGQKLNVAKGISAIPGYVKVR